MDDREALREYVQSRSDQAFRCLVERHVDMVWSSARRQLRDASLADDATQAVFIILSKKARSISPDKPLSPWLYKVTRYVCRNAVRQAARRAAHERKAAEMRGSIETAPEELRDEISPLLDRALASLATRDRDALLLRYFQKMSMQEVGESMGISEEAARKRVARGLERLEENFKHSGITAPLAVLDAGLPTWAVQAAPQAIHQSAAASLSAGSTAATTIAKGAMFMISLKTNIVATSIVVTFLIGTTTAIVAVAPNTERAAQLENEGWALWQQQKYAQAEPRFSAAVKLDPKRTNAWNGLGWSQFNQGNPKEAEKAFEKAIKLDPTFAPAENGLGWINFNDNNLDQAEQHWLKAGPNASASWAGLARIYLLAGKWDQAKTYASKLVDSGDASAKPLLEAALAQTLSDELKNQISPPAKNAGAMQRGWQLINQGRATDAVTIFRSLVASSPDDVNALNGLGWALFHSGKSAEAKTQFEKALSLKPDTFGSMNGLALILKQQGKTDQAIDLWTKLDAVAGDAASNAGTYQLAFVYLDQKKYDKALPLFKRLARDMPEDQAVKKGLEQAQANSGL